MLYPKTSCRTLSSIRKRSHQLLGKTGTENYTGCTSSSYAFHQQLALLVLFTHPCARRLQSGLWPTLTSPVSVGFFHQHGEPTLTEDIQGLTAGYHRLWTHRAYKATRTLEYVLAILGAGVVEGSIAWWARGHRAHHRYTDTDLDPYDARKGLLYSHIGWMIFKPRRKPGFADVSDLRSNPVVKWQHKYYLLLAFIMAVVVPTCVAGYGWGDWQGGFIWTGMIRLVVVQHVSILLSDILFETDVNNRKVHFLCQLAVPLARREAIRRQAYIEGLRAYGSDYNGRRLPQLPPPISHGLPQRVQVVSIRSDQMVPVVMRKARFRDTSQGSLHLLVLQNYIKLAHPDVFGQ